MKRLMLRLSTLLVLVLLAGASGCGVDSIQTRPDAVVGAEDSARMQSRLWTDLSTPDRFTIRRSSSGPASDPRMIELWLKTTNVASVLHSEAGVGLVEAGKELIVQEKGDGLIRVLAFSSSNVAPIGAGELGTLELERETDGRPMRVEILTDRPMFAPQEAQKGLMVGDPIEL